MTGVSVYGIKNCETMKKAFAWLARHKIEYVFHDYKKEGADKALLKRLIAAQGWENILNRKGMTWRALPEALKSNMTDKSALETALEKPSIIRRPLILRGEKALLGFDEAAFAVFFKKS